jgi:predicted membrane channel-forming protein YqfA (hemolysin III family)
MVPLSPIKNWHVPILYNVFSFSLLKIFECSFTWNNFLSVISDCSYLRQALKQKSCIHLQRRFFTFLLLKLIDDNLLLPYLTVIFRHNLEIDTYPFCTMCFLFSLLKIFERSFTWNNFPSVISDCSYLHQSLKQKSCIHLQRRFLRSFF